MKYTKRQQKANRKKLIKALRQGDYDQAQGNLRVGDSFCCLGVACDISNLDEWEDAPETDEELFDIPYYLGANQVLPFKVMSWLGFRTCTGEMNDKRNLAGLNDEGASFEEIADIIEKEPEGLIV